MAEKYYKSSDLKKWIDQMYKSSLQRGRGSCKTTVPTAFGLAVYYLSKALDDLPSYEEKDINPISDVEDFIDWVIQKKDGGNE